MGSFPFPPTVLDHSVIRITGADAEHLLERIVTCVIPKAGGATAGALLTPQGKILFDFQLIADDDGFWLDLVSTVAAEAIKRFSFYKLRADVTIEDRSDEFAIVVSMEKPTDALIAYRDPRLDALGWRAIVQRSTASAGNVAGWHAHRIGLGVPEGIHDYELGNAFPHDAAMDRLGAVGFEKGCYVGQEVVSRMEHRGTARRRPMLLLSDDQLETGAEIRAGGKRVGTVGSTSAGLALAIVRVDKVVAARDEGNSIIAGDVEVKAVRPGWGTWAAPDPLAGFTEEEAEAYRVDAQGSKTT